MEQKGRNTLTTPAIAGTVPPSAQDLEASVLGAIMLEPRAFQEVAEILTEEAFYIEKHQIIYSAMASLAARYSQIDMLTVVEELKRTGKLDAAGGPASVVRVTNGVVSSAHIETHSRIILEKYLRRQAIRISHENIAMAYDDQEDVFDLLNDMESKIFALSLNVTRTSYDHISAGIKEVTNRVEHLKTLDTDITGVTSGYKKVDSITHGWQPADLIILAARPSVGKTAFALNLARNASMNPDNPVAVGFFSLEMSTSQLTERLLSRESGIWLKSIKTGKMDEQENRTFYERGVNPLYQAPIYVDDTAGISVYEMRAKARRMVKKHGVGIIIVDYLQLMNGSRRENRSGNREQEISNISRNLKGLAKELNVPVIALSQLSREVEKRADRMPQLSDLRESGAIEQDADIVSFLYRPSKEEQKKNDSLKELGYFNIAKNRNGELADIVFRVNNNIQLWEEESFASDFLQPQGGITNYKDEESPF